MKRDRDEITSYVSINLARIRTTYASLWLQQIDRFAPLVIKARAIHFYDRPPIIRYCEYILSFGCTCVYLRMRRYVRAAIVRAIQRTAEYFLPLSLSYSLLKYSISSR